MSQNILVTTSSIGRVRVAAGWDRPLQELFCNVQALDEEKEDEAEKADVDYPDCLMRFSYESADEIAECLKGASIVLPPQMVDAVRNDQAAGAGNVYRVFREDGTLEQEQKF